MLNKATKTDKLRNHKQVSFKDYWKDKERYGLKNTKQNKSLIAARRQEWLLKHKF